MKIAVIGATGFVGSAMLQETLQRGHEVTAIMRHPEKVTSHPKLRPHKADFQKGDEVTRSVAGHDAVISAFNPGWTNPNIYDLQVKGTRAIIVG
jgi:putative NADH-flavin reductase